MAKYGCDGVAKLPTQSAVLVYLSIIKMHLKIYKTLTCLNVLEDIEKVF